METEVGAKRLGARLMAEVEVESLSSLLSSLRDNSNTSQDGSVYRKYFNIAELDSLLPKPATATRAAGQQPPQSHSYRGVIDRWDPNLPHPEAPAPVIAHTANNAVQKGAKAGGPVVEFISPPPSHHTSGAGKTSLIYLITALAILPQSFSSIELGGRNAAVIVFDPLSHFRMPRLVEVMTALIIARMRDAGIADLSDGNLSKEIQNLIKRSLVHVHIFRPQSWASLLTTLKSLPDYLFDASQHRSMHRVIHSIVLEDIDAFYCSLRSLSNITAVGARTPANPVLAASAKLTSALLDLSCLLSCMTILTSRSSSASSFRPYVPASWPADVQTTRLAIRRVEVLKFAPGTSVEDAERERQQRWEVVQRGRFECWKIGLGAKDADGFIFRVGQGIEVEKEESAT